jgi:hypothetical protein
MPSTRWATKVSTASRIAAAVASSRIDTSSE